VVLDLPILTISLSLFISVVVVHYSEQQVIIDSTGTN